MPHLISAEELLGRGGDPHVRIADCRWYLGAPDRGARAYAAGHVPTAVHVDLERDLSGPEGGGRHPLPLPTDFASSLGRLGIGNDDLVVVYDDLGGVVAARLWWMLTAIGHDDVAILDGGLRAWTNAGGELTSNAPGPEQVVFATDFVGWPGTLDRLHLEQRLGSLRLIDARAPERFRGDSEPIDPVAGRIPTAVNIPTDAHLGPGSHFRSAADLATLYGEQELPTVVYCGSGVSACHNAFAMELAGLPRPMLYPGSWSDWSMSGGAIETG